MAVYKIFPNQDTSIYSGYPLVNAGIDAILQVNNLNPTISGSTIVARSLIQFPQDQINEVITNKVSSSSWDSRLKCFIADAEGIILESNLHAYPISGSWNNGSGMFKDTPPITNGCSWKFRTTSGSGEWSTSSFSAYVTASYSSSIGGGTWYTGSSNTNLDLTPSQSFNIRTNKDLNLGVTDIVKAWYSSSNSLGSDTSISNNGFIIKWSDDLEFNSDINIQPSLNYYSVDTNTIYPPVLEIRWDDFTYSTGSLSEISTPDVFIALDNNPGVFYSESINRFRLNVRPEFPARTYQTSSYFTTNYTLPTASYYALKDLDTDEFIIDFHPTFTKVSCDSTGNYFDIYMNGLEPERYYKILIQTTIDGSTIVKDEKYYFKVVNG